MDWMGPTFRESVEEREAGMSSLVAGFAVRMRKQAASP